MTDYETEGLIKRIGLLMYLEMSLEDIHETIVDVAGVSEEDFFLAYKAAEFASNWEDTKP